MISTSDKAYLNELTIILCNLETLTFEESDHRKIYEKSYSPPKKPTIVDVHTFSFVMMDGTGNPYT
jgi:hypothetical protein